VKERTFYHASWTGNVPGIISKGIVPRSLEDADRIIDEVLAQYGETRETVPRYYWYYPLLRLQETAGKVYLSGDRDYAACNCLAGFEAEVQLRSYLEARKRRRKFRHLPPEEAMKREISCSVCEIRIDESEIPGEIMEDFKARAKRAAQAMPHKFPTEQAALDYILSKVTITLDKVAPDKIVKCQFIGGRDDFEKCGLKKEG